MADKTYDLCIIGGGINGAGIARDAAGRGLSVILIESEDLASGTSSMSTKLIHGGLRYLEYYDFKLVRESLKEREALMKIAPHIIWPMEFVLPHDKTQRPYLMIRAGLFLYDNLARREVLKGSKGVALREHRFGAPLDHRFKRGFVYSDCWVEDSRLVALNAMDAASYGAEIRTYTKCMDIKRGENGWRIDLRDQNTDMHSQVSANMVVNAAGPWVSKVLSQAGLDQVAGTPSTRLVKGSHIITNRLHDGDQSYIIQNTDGRIVFVIPYEHDFTLIGTTEEAFGGDPRDAQISDQEMDYLCEVFNNNFKKQIDHDDVIWAFSGVRPLFDDGEQQAHKVSRDHKIHVHEEGKNPMLSVFGGKLTTYRVVAEQVVDQLMKCINQPDKQGWTTTKPLPGGDIMERDFESFLDVQGARYPFVPGHTLRRYGRAYGTRMALFLDGARGLKDLGQHLGDGVYEAEVIYLLHYEFARTAEDILWRRSKLGMHVSKDTIKALEELIPKILKKMNKT